ncbi:MAG: SphA family protein [Gammaproteobacteria bacterium]
MRNRIPASVGDAEPLRHALRAILYGGVIATLFGGAGGVWAGELGHYPPGLPNIRDFFVPEPGFYYIQYHYLYSTDTLKDRNGNEVGSLARTGPLGTTTVTVDPDIDVFALVPTFAWVSSWQVLGARYGAYIAPSFADNSAQVNLSLARSGRFRDTGSSTTLDSDTGFGVGDLFVQPLWLGWSGKHYDVAAGYGFYAPTGEEGIGLEFWTNQFQLAGAWYPFENRGTAITLAGTYEIQSEMDDQDLTPGDRVSLNWGVSQYVPLTKDQTWLAELGASGYSQWQVEEDSGSDVPQIRNVQLNAKDEVHAAGIQAGLTFVPWKAALTVRYQWEFGAEARFEGENLVVTLAKGF